MSTRSENTVTIDQPLEKVIEAYHNRDYWTYIAETLSPEPGEVNEFGGGEVTLFEVLPLDVLPEAVRAMVSQSLKLKRVITIGELSEGTVPLTYTADVKGTPVDFSGEMKVTAAGEGTAIAYENEVSVNIPFMGPAIEPKVAEALEKLFQQEGDLTSKWISEHL
ncbi:MAG TPA: DUF2505 domain-containing protein [Corynebacterium sp.]|nr:DUF2505 domain-containing protein [Corynebacterium sp.]